MMRYEWYWEWQRGKKNYMKAEKNISMKNDDGESGSDIFYKDLFSK